MESSQLGMVRSGTLLVSLPSPGPSVQDSDLPIPHEGVAHPLDEVHAERGSSNPSPPLSDHSPTPRGISAPLGDATAPSLEEALVNLDVEDNTVSAKGAASRALLDANADALGDANHFTAPLTLLEIIRQLRLHGYTVPPNVEAIARDTDVFDSNGEPIVTSIDLDPERVADEAKLQVIVEQGERLEDSLDQFMKILDSLALAESQCTSEVATSPVLTPVEALIRLRRGGMAELFQTREGRDFVLLYIGLEFLQVAYKLWRLRREIESAQ